MSEKPKYNHNTRLITVLSLMLVIISTGLLVFTGCKNSRDSGGTVTGRSIRFPGGDGVSFIRVLTDGDNTTRFKVTDSNGSFTTLHVPTGSYTVTFARFGIELYSEDLVIEENDTTYIVNMPGIVPGIDDLSGVVEDFVGAIGHAEVWVFYADGSVAYAMADEHGQYMIPDLPDGDITVVAVAPDHEIEIIEDLRIGFEGTRILDIELDVIAEFDGGSVSGIVRNQDGEILEDAYVGIFENNVLPSIYAIAQDEALTTAVGYEFPDIPEGTYTVICTRSGYLISSELVIVEPLAEYTVDFVLEAEECP